MLVPRCRKTVDLNYRKTFALKCRKMFASMSRKTLSRSCRKTLNPKCRCGHQVVIKYCKVSPLDIFSINKAVV